MYSLFIYVLLLKRQLFKKLYKTHKDKNTNTNDGSSDFKSSSDDYYNSSDFRINNDDDYYNSSDYKNNLLADKPQQSYSGFDNKVGFTYQ